MIKMSVDTKDLTKLINQMRIFTQQVEQETMNTIIELSDKTNNKFDTKMDDLVYSKYDPFHYKRTFHLKGKDGSKVERTENNGLSKSYEFFIDENSRDRSGESWYDKSERVESGDLRGAAPERLFIEETQNELKRGLKESADKYNLRIKALLRRS